MAEFIRVQGRVVGCRGIIIIRPQPHVFEFSGLEHLAMSVNKTGRGGIDEPPSHEDPHRQHIQRADALLRENP